MKKILWLNMQSYQVRVVMVRGTTPGTHMLVVGGEGLAQPQTQDSLSKLGFRVGPRGNYFRPAQGISLANLQASFPAASLEEMPITAVMPPPKTKQVKHDERSKENNTPGGNEHRPADDASAGTSRVLGESGSRGDDAAQPAKTERYGRRGDSAAVPDAPAGKLAERGADAGEGLATEKPVAGRRDVQQPNSLAQPVETGRAGNPPGRDPAQLRSARQRVISNAQGRLKEAIALAQSAAEMLGLELTDWQQSEASDLWAYSEISLGGVTVPIGASSGGVVSVNRSPFTRPDMGSVAHDQALPILTTLSAELRTVLDEDFYLGVSRAIYESGQVESALAHFGLRWPVADGQDLESAFKLAVGIEQLTSKSQSPPANVATDSEEPAEDEGGAHDSAESTGQVAEQIQPVAPEQIAPAPTLREWRGITAEELEEAFNTEANCRYNDSQAKRSEEALAALAAAETGVELTDKQRLSVCRFMGWGGVSSDFRTDNKKEHENSQGNDAAKALGIERGEFNRHVVTNRLESYYTPPPFISAIWSGLSKLGVPADGRYLEPGCGAGYFFAGAPAAVQQAAKLVGVECDEIAVRFAKVVAPDAVILPQRFERVVLDRSFDAVIGNVPFGETKVVDREYPDAKHVHDYFIVRGLDHLRAGGVMAVITSSGTLDKQSTSVREQIYERADLLGAFRLPVEAFSDQGASVVTDILFLQRRPDGAKKGFDFTATEPIQVDGQEYRVNTYFQRNPENVIGDFCSVSSQFGMKLSVTAGLKSATRLNVKRIAEQLLPRIAETLPEAAAARTEWEMDAQQGAAPAAVNSQLANDEQAVLLSGYDGFVGEFCEHDGLVVEIIDVINEFDDDGVLLGEKHVGRVVELSPEQDAIMRSFIAVKKAARDLLAAQMQSSDEALANEQARALAVYERFVESHGPINSAKCLRVYGDDSGAAEACALEVWDDEAEKVVQLADVFHSRVISIEASGAIETAVDAYYVCIDRRADIDFDFMSDISGIDVDTLKQELVGSLVYLNPKNGKYESATNYLSGDVVTRLREAREAALSNSSYEINVAALEKVQPAPIPFEDISLTIGASWIPADDIRHFTRDLFGLSALDERHFRVRHTPEIGLWTVDVSPSFKRDNEAHRTKNWGNDRLSYEQLLEKLLNNERPTHYDKGRDDRSVVNDQATLLSREKQEELASRFRDWVASDVARAARYTHLYNTTCNVYVVPKPDGSRLTFPGLSASWQPREHQRDFVALGLHGYNAMAAHTVGAGKTFEMVALAMKQRQVGMARKPSIAVPNHMLGQIAREAKQMYPAARVLMVTQADLAGPARKRFLAITRNNNWDLVVMTHSMLNQLRASPEVMLSEHRRIVDLISSHIDGCDNKREERQLVAKLKTAQSKFDALEAELADEVKAGKMIQLSELGIDCLHVDEAHLYRRLELASSMNVLGVTSSGSNRAFNLNAIATQLRNDWGKPFGMFFYTGTPIANTMCELYVHTKMLRPDILEDAGIHHFDEWAARFGSVVSSLEALPEGGGFKVSERFAKFVNLPEMVRMFRIVADVKTKQDLKLPVPVVNTKVVTVPQTDIQKAFMTHLAIRANAIRERTVDAGEDNMLSIATAGRKAALDMRMVESTLPETSSLKLGAVAENVVALYNMTHEQRGAQLVFLDLGTPGKDKKFVAYEALREMLVSQGVPRKDVAFIHEAKTHEAKEALFARVREGDVRVLVGSTEKMGVGTNVQKRLVAMHDVDCPWNPAGIEQRRGRGERQGNEFFSEVFNFRYTTQDSFDLFMWETNKRKGDFINQALADPETAAREVSEAMDLGYAEVMAITTGDPKIREKVDIDDKVNKLERKRKAWISERASRMFHAEHLRQRMEAIARDAEMMGRIAAAMPKRCAPHVTVEGSIAGLQDGPTSWLTSKEAGAAVASRYALLESRLMRMMTSEADLDVRVGDIKLQVVKVRSSLGTAFEIAGSLDGERLPYHRVQMSKNPTYTGRGLMDWIDLPSSRLRKGEEEQARCSRALAQLRVDDDAWPHEEELARLQGLKKELDKHFMSVSAKSVPSEDPFLKMLAAHRRSLVAAQENCESAEPDETVEGDADDQGASQLETLDFFDQEPEMPQRSSLARLG